MPPKGQGIFLIFKNSLKLVPVNLYQGQKSNKRNKRIKTKNL